MSIPRRICTVSVLLGIAAASCVGVGPKLPAPTNPEYQPPETFNLALDEMWSVINDVLDSEKIIIATADRAEGRIVTDYVEGRSSVGLVSNQSRYRYNVRLTSKGDNSTGLVLTASLESSGDKTRWHDVTSANKGLARNLELWLYERIDNEARLRTPTRSAGRM